MANLRSESIQYRTGNRIIRIDTSSTIQSNRLYGRKLESKIGRNQTDNNIRSNTILSKSIVNLNKVTPIINPLTYDDDFLYRSEESSDQNFNLDSTLLVASNRSIVGVPMIKSDEFDPDETNRNSEKWLPISHRTPVGRLSSIIYDLDGLDHDLDDPIIEFPVSENIFNTTQLSIRNLVDGLVKSIPRDNQIRDFRSFTSNNSSTITNDNSLTVFDQNVESGNIDTGNYLGLTTRDKRLGSIREQVDNLILSIRR